MSESPITHKAFSGSLLLLGSPELTGLLVKPNHGVDHVVAIGKSVPSLTSVSSCRLPVASPEDKPFVEDWKKAIDETANHLKVGKRVVVVSDDRPVCSTFAIPLLLAVGVPSPNVTDIALSAGGEKPSRNQYRLIDILSRHLAERRRLESSHTIVSALGYSKIDPVTLRKELGSPFPSSLTVLQQEGELVVGCAARDRAITKSKYELDAWAFALLSTRLGKGLKRISLAVVCDGDEDLAAQKWWNLLIRRVAYLESHRAEEAAALRIIIISNGEADEVPLRPEILDWHIYPPQALKERKPKTKHDRENEIQCGLEKYFNRIYPTAKTFQEFPISFLGSSGLTDKHPFRADLVVFQPYELWVIELKHGDNKELDILPQILDYYLYFENVKARLENAGWPASERSKVLPIVASPSSHPLLDSVAKVYSRYGFDASIRQVLQGQNAEFYLSGEEVSS